MLRFEDEMLILTVKSIEKTNIATTFMITYAWAYLQLPEVPLMNFDASDPKPLYNEALNP